MNTVNCDIKIEISKCCRLCLKSDQIIRNIFSSNPGTEHNSNRLCWVEKNISSQIYECTNIIVDEHDATSVICEKCLKEIINFMAFRKRCLNANQYLHEQYNGVIIRDNRKVSSDNMCYVGFLDLGNETDYCVNKDVDREVTVDGIEIQPEKLPKLNLSLRSPTPSSFLADESDKDFESDGNYFEQSMLVKCSYKLKDKKPQRYIEPWPKLRKRDFMETKAYHGLCHICGKLFQHLWVHLQSHSEVATDTCDICGKGFRSKPNLALHILTHKDAEHPCDICGKKYRTKMRLKRHMRIHTGERPFTCKICQKKFYTKYNLNVHFRIHSGEKPFSCEYCSEKFTHSYAIKHHLKKMHSVP